MDLNLYGILRRMPEDIDILQEPSFSSLTREGSILREIDNTLPPGELRWNGLYDEWGFHLFSVLEIGAQVGAGRGLYNAAAKSYVPGEEGAPLYLCPADILAALEAEMKQLAVAAFEAIGALDVGRVDFRLGADSRPYLLEINTLPGLNPTVSDLCIMARAEGMHYTDLINEILYLAADRYAQERGSWKDRQTRGMGAAHAFPDSVLDAWATVPVGEE